MLLKEWTMSYKEIMDEIINNLTGDKQKDLAYLEQQCEKYKDSEYGLEIARACGREIANLLEDDEMDEIINVFKNRELDIHSVLEEVRFNQYKKNYDKALELIEQVIQKVETLYNDGLYKEDKVSKFFCFDEVMEEILYKFHKKPKKEVRGCDIPYAKIYMQYGSLLIDKERWEEAQEVLLKALEWNPCSSHIIFELCETYKHFGQLEKFYETVIDTFKYCFTETDLARCYRYLGWYFVEKELYDEAICVYILSFQYEKNQSVQSELFYISQSTGKDIVKPEIDDIKKLAEKYNFPVGADEDLLGLVMYLGKQSLKEEVIPAAKYYFGILYRLTEDDDVKEILDRLEKSKLD